MCIRDSQEVALHHLFRVGDGGEVHHLVRRQQPVPVEGQLFRGPLGPGEAQLVQPPAEQGHGLLSHALTSIHQDGAGGKGVGVHDGEKHHERNPHPGPEAGLSAVGFVGLFLRLGGRLRCV